MQLSRAGLKWNKDTWDSVSLYIITSVATVSRFGLLSHEFCMWAGLRQRLMGQGCQFLSQCSLRPQALGWYGIYSSPTVKSPNYVLHGKHIHSLRLPVDFGTIELTEDVVVYIVLKLSQVL
jgi:hypothetical protein